MFSLMGNCCSCIKQKRQPRRSVTLAILGLDSAGKTTTTNALLGEALDTAPTIGFNKEDVTFKNYNITLYDLGGGSRIRDIWKDYFSEIYGVIYVVDTAAPDRFPEVKQSLKSLLSHELVREKPLLLLGNKIDLGSHVNEVDVMEQLNLEQIVNENKCPSKLAMCSALKGTGKKMDPMIRDGVTWLCSLLDQVYEKLKIRVDRDVEVVEQIRQKEKEERKERVRKAREERLKKEEEERKKLGEEPVDNEDQEDDIVGDNPWKRLDSEEIKKKEEKFKQAKAKEKERQKKLKEIEEHENPTVTALTVSNTSLNATSDDDNVLRAPRSSRTLFSLGWMNGGHITNDEEGGNSHRSNRQMLPPLEGLSNTKAENGSPVSTGRGKKQNKKLKNKVESYDGGDNEEFSLKGTSSVSRIQVESIHHHDDNDDDNDSVIQSSGRRDPFRKSRGLYIDERTDAQGSPDSARKKSRKKKAQGSSDGEEGFDTLRLSQHLDTVDGYPSHVYSSRQSPSPKGITNGDIEERSVTPVKKLKKKKKHLRKNKLAPSDDEFELSDVQSTPKKQPVPWVRSPSPRKMLDDEDTHTNWGMAEDLSADDVKKYPRSRPNFDSEDDLIL